MVKAQPPTGPVLQFQGRRDFPIEAGIDDWGLNAAQQETYVEQFRLILVKHKAWDETIDYFTLRRFLRARSYDLDKAVKMWLDHVAWREANGVDDILQSFYFSEREKFLAAYPQGYHKTDKMGRPVYIQLIGQIDMKAVKACTTEDRMYKFHVQEYERCMRVIMPICSRLAKRQIDQTFGIMDVRGVGMSHLTGEVKKLLTRFTKTDQDNYPECMGHMCIINAPAVFRMVWSVIKGMLDVRTQEKIEILGSNYLPALEKWIPLENIPVFLGGRSAGTLLDDLGPWSDTDLVNSIGLDVEDLRHGKSTTGGHMLTIPAFGRTSSDENASGYLTPSGSITSAASITMGAGSSMSAAPQHRDAAARPSGTLTAIPESKTKTLLERIQAIEQLIPGEMERLRAGALPAAVESGAATGTVSTRSAPEGSLLARVEVLEEALDTLLQAQAALIAQQKATEAELEAERNRNKQPKSSRACCVVM